MKTSKTTKIFLFLEQWIILIRLQIRLKNDKTKNMISLKKVLLSIQWNFDSVIILEPGNMVMRAFDMHKKSTYGRVCVRDYTKTCNFKFFFSLFDYNHSF